MWFLCIYNSADVTGHLQFQFIHVDFLKALPNDLNRPSVRLAGILVLIFLLLLLKAQQFLGHFLLMELAVLTRLLKYSILFSLTIQR